jgi:ABC-type multidrug transport system fused ATPase/permease subunit
MLTHAKKYNRYLIFSMLAILGATASQLYSPMVVRELTALIREQDPSLASRSLTMSVLLLGTSVIFAVCSFARSYLTHYAAWHFVSDLRVMVYNKIQSMSLRYFHDKQTGQLMSRIVNDTGDIELLIAHAAPDVIVNVIIFAGIAVLLFVINPLLAALSLIPMPVLALLSRNYAKKVRPLFRLRQQKIGDLNGTLQDNISGVKEIQIFNKAEMESEKVRGHAVSIAEYTLRALKRSTYYSSGIQFLSTLGTVIVIGFGGYWASFGRVPVEDIVAFLLYLSMFYAPITTMGRVNEDIQTAMASAERIFEVLDAEPDIKEAENPVQIGKAKGDIRFENVSFSYIDGIDVLRDINVNMQSGKIVALVGPTGVGKTTFINLINRFYDPIEGNIYIDGVNLKDVALTSLHDNISIVLQDVFLFNGSVFDNIAYGCPNASREKVIEAAKVARAHDFIINFENGYDTLIGERGVKLSGGQKQRISIARAVLRDKPVLILDEATASVDVETEKLIHEAMDQIMENRTTIIIAHRLSTVKKADVIIVLNDCSIEETGSHSELVKNGGLYAKLSEIQL